MLSAWSDLGIDSVSRVYRFFLRTVSEEVLVRIGLRMKEAWSFIAAVLSCGLLYGPSCVAAMS